MASLSADQLVEDIRALTASGELTRLSVQICEIFDSLLQKGACELEQILGELETSGIVLHSFGYMCILFAKLTVLPESSWGENELMRASDFIKCCVADHIRVRPEIFTELCHLLTKQYVAKEQYLAGVSTLLVAVEKLQLHANELTSIHADLCQLSLSAKCFRPVLPILDADIIAIQNEPNNFNCKYFLLYYYYGAVIYAAVKNYERAFFFLEVVLTTPTNTLSHIMLAARKKYILIALILHGTKTNAPQNLAKFPRSLIEPYLDLERAYTQMRNPSQVMQIMRKHENIFVNDHNMGIVKQVLKSLYRKNMKQLTKTFYKLSLGDVAIKVALNDSETAEKIILDMVQDNEISAKINHKDGMVTFYDEPKMYESSAILLDLEKRILETAALNKRVQDWESQIEVLPRFIHKLHQKSASSSSENTNFV